MIAALVFSGSGCGNADQSIDLQRDKELNVIEAQKQKEIEVLRYQQSIRAQEERDKQAAFDDCLAIARSTRSDSILNTYRVVGQNYDLALKDMPLDPARFMAYTEAICGKAPSVQACRSFIVKSLTEADAEYEKDEIDCYARYK